MSTYEHPMKAADASTTTRISIAIAIVGLALFTLGLHDQGFIGFESRFALFAKEMLRHGPSVFPTTYGQPYPDYPATATLLIYGLTLPLGEVGRLAAALPTALAAALNLALSYRLLAPLSQRWAALAVCFELLTFSFLAEARALSLDQMVTTVTLGSFLLVYSADRKQQPARLRWLPLLFLCGFAVRGPLGLIIPAGVVCSYYALSAQWLRLLRVGAVALLLLAVAWGALLALAAHQGGQAFVADVIRMQVAGRMEQKSEASHFYYFTSSFGNYALSWPVACLVLAAVAHRFRERASDRALALVFLLAGWVLVVMIGLSIPHTKKARYLLPVVPALAAIATYPFVAHGDRALAVLRGILRGTLLLLPGLAFVAVGYARWYADKNGLDLQLPWRAGLLIPAVCQLIAIFALLAGARKPGRDVGLALCAAFALWFANIALVEPAQRQIHDTHAFVQAVERLRARQPAPLAFYAMGRDAEAIKYLVNIDYELRPAFFYRADEFTTVAGSLYVVAPAGRDAELRAAGLGTPVFSGRFDNKNFSVFYRRGTDAGPADPGAPVGLR